MTAPTFTHNALLTARLEACIAFYTERCGLRVVKDRVGEGPFGRVVWLAPVTGTQPIFVLAEAEARAELTGASEPVMRHFGFDMGTREAVDAHYASFLRAGLSASEPRDWGEVAGYLFVARDPDGRVVEFSAGQDVSPENWDAAP